MNVNKQITQLILNKDFVKAKPLIKDLLDIEASKLLMSERMGINFDNKGE